MPPLTLGQAVAGGGRRSYLNTTKWVVTCILSALVSTTFLNIYQSSLVDMGQAALAFQPNPDHFKPVLSDGRAIGQTIVAEAFYKSYVDLVSSCHTGIAWYKKCIHEMFLVGQNTTNEYVRRWPWWYRTLLRDTSILKTGVHGSWHILQYYSPNIQQCIVEKAGTKTWRDVHCQTIQDREAKATTMKLNNYTLFNCNRLQRQQIPNSDRVVFLRDPLDRFLSGFLDKCVGRNVYTQGHCEPNVVFKHNTTTGTPIADFQEDAKTLFEIYVDTFPLKWNLHFIPQSLFCDGLYRHIGNYSFVGSMMNGDLVQDLQRFKESYPELSRTVDSVFALNVSSVDSTTSSGVETKAAEKTKQYYSPHTVKRVLEYYSIDYVMLDIPIPQWAEEMLAQDAGATH